MRGRILLAGLDIEQLSMADLLDVAWALWNDSINGWVDREELRVKLDEAMRSSWRDRETWDNAADAGEVAAMMEHQAPMLTPEELEARRRAREQRQAASARE